MTRVILAVVAVVLSGCAYYTQPEVPVVQESAAVLTRDQFEASKARTECRAMARNLLQVARCDGR